MPLSAAERNAIAETRRAVAALLYELERQEAEDAINLMALVASSARATGSIDALRHIVLHPRT